MSVMVAVTVFKARRVASRQKQRTVERRTFAGYVVIQPTRRRSITMRLPYCYQCRGSCRGTITLFVVASKVTEGTFGRTNYLLRDASSSSCTDRLRYVLSQNAMVWDHNRNEGLISRQENASSLMPIAFSTEEYIPKPL